MIPTIAIAIDDSLLASNKLIWRVRERERERGLSVARATC
jgi:hypothetical protein